MRYRSKFDSDILRSIPPMDCPDQIVVLTSEHIGGGLGEVARQCRKLGVNTHDARPYACKALVAIPPDQARNRIRSQRQNIIYTMFESSSLPDFWVHELNRNYEKILVPHPAVRDTFIRSSVTTPVEIVNLGYSRRIRTSLFTHPDKEIVIGSLGDGFDRKNFANLVKAVDFLITRGYAIKLKLHLSATTLTGVDPEYLRTLYQRPYTSISIGLLSEEELNDWYQSLHVFAFCPKAEGWAFPPREAMYLGLPLVISNIPVHEELIASGFVTAVQSDGEEPAFYEIYSDYFGRWPTFSSNSIASSLEKVILNYDEKLERAAEGAKWITPMWTWDSFIQKMRHHV